MVQVRSSMKSPKGPKLGTFNRIPYIVNHSWLHAYSILSWQQTTFDPISIVDFQKNSGLDQITRLLYPFHISIDRCSHNGEDGTKQIWRWQSDPTRMAREHNIYQLRMLTRAFHLPPEYTLTSFSHFIILPQHNRIQGKKNQTKPSCLDNFSEGYAYFLYIIQSQVTGIQKDTF